MFFLSATSYIFLLDTSCQYCFIYFHCFCSCVIYFMLVLVSSAVLPVALVDIYLVGDFFLLMLLLIFLFCLLPVIFFCLMLLVSIRCFCSAAFISMPHI